MSEKQWCYPKRTDKDWVHRTRNDYPEDTKEMSDDGVRDYYADGLKYQNLWDNLGDAVEEHEALADAYLASEARIKALEGDLFKYGSHSPACPSRLGHQRACECGFDKALQKDDNDKS